MTKEPQTSTAEAQPLTVLPDQGNTHEVSLTPEGSTNLTPEVIANVTRDLDITDSTSIIHFGSQAQVELTTISQEILAGVKNKEAGPAGDSLRNMVTTIRGFTIEQGDLREKTSWWEKLLGRAAPIATFMARYENIQSQIDTISDNLLQHEHTLMKDVKFLDVLYEKALEFYRNLGVYIAAGEAIIQRMDEVDIPKAQSSFEAAAETDSMMFAQELRDIRASRDAMERRVHDLKLTRQVTMQALPSMRMVQENDKSLIVKINSTLTNTIPLWETQLAQAITIQRSSDAAAAVRNANDLTNELLTSNANNLRDANRTIRQEMERGIFDIEAVKSANADLIATIEDSLQIADEGKRARASAENEIARMEENLKATLAQASSQA
jgi:uncharacterized protein YaaN involved in tellurite resistance